MYKNFSNLRKMVAIAICLAGSATMFAQDVITLKNGNEIQGVVQEVGADDVKYKKNDNPTGPNYTLKKSEVFMIKYKNGSKDVFKEEDQNSVVLDENLLEISRKNPEALLKKGNKVFVEANEASKGACKEYFIPAMKDWGYWTIVDRIEESHFIIVFNIEGKAMGDRASSVVFKTRENQDFKKSKSYRGSINAFSGYNAFRAASNKIVENYFKKEYK